MSAVLSIRVRHVAWIAAAAALAACVVAPLKLSRDDSGSVLSGLSLDAPDPSLKGSLGVKRLYYGSGTDRRRAEFRDSVTIRTATVDGTKFASAPDPQQAKIRKDFWGFDFSRLPVNGRVWYPDGAGPYPLVLIVHGNHNMAEFSDPGYGYLGELLASRGFILASVDENFLNGFMRGENDARGWMLLKHLQAWKRFNDSAGSPLQGRVDMHNIALMGHSRGGEAVAVAGMFNRLRHYPDDGNTTFDFNFDIKSLVAIAPVDGQYRPMEKGTPLADYNYLLMHGSHDGDVSSFSGLTQYERIRYTGKGDYFKSAFYVYRANHGQWNTVWGSTDGGPRSRRSLDLRGFMTQAEQRRFAEVVISAFLEATLKGKQEYLPLFRDHRTAGRWLPKTMYVTRFQDSRFTPVADFEDDVDVTTGGPGVTLAGDSLATWKESLVPFRNRGSNMQHNAVTLAWNNRIAGDDTTRRGRPAAFGLTLGDSVRRALALDPGTSLVFSMAPLEGTPGRRQPARDTTRKADSTSKRAPARRPPTPKATPDTTPMDLSVVAVDADGRSARVALSTYGPVRRPLEAFVYRRAGRDKQRFSTTYEVVLQTFTIPLADFERAAPGFDPSRLVTVRWLFDRTEAGTVLLDNIGFSHMRPEFFTSAPGEAGR
ncbi:MAG: MFS transporter [Gemmatimonadaceae bacterium]|nr:MFS transporter [Gemmatimonadaceae bacterium]